MINNKLITIDEEKQMMPIFSQLALNLLKNYPKCRENVIVELKKSYNIKWDQIKDYYFLKLPFGVN